MPQILNFSEHANDEEVSYLTTLLLYHLVERCGGQIQFTVNDVNQVRESLSTKMVQIQLGDDVRLQLPSAPPGRIGATRTFLVAVPFEVPPAT